MADTVFSRERLKIIDKCLRGNKHWSTRQLFEECNRVFIAEGKHEHIISAINTIRNDMNQIREEFPQSIIEVKNGRYKSYTYADPEFSYFHLPFKDEELAKLTQVLLMLNKYDGLPQMDWVYEMLERFKVSTNIETNFCSVVGFDESEYLVGREYYTPILNAITQKTALEVTYQNFKRGIIFTALVYPYYLKQYNKRWFLLAWNDRYDCLSTFALDRIVNLEVSEAPYRENNAIDFNEYFDDLVGVSKAPDNKVQKIKLRLAPDVWPYVHTKPIHSTQKRINEECDPRNTVIQIEVQPNFELEQLLISYGEGLEVLEPQWLRDKMRNRIQAMLSNYTKV